MTLHELAAALDAKKAGRHYFARCPAHEDKTPSLHLSEKEGRILVRCFGGCDNRAVIEALRGLNLWTDRDPTTPRPQAPLWQRNLRRQLLHDAREWWIQLRRVAEHAGDAELAALIRQKLASPLSPDSVQQEYDFYLDRIRERRRKIETWRAAGAMPTAEEYPDPSPDPLAAQFAGPLTEEARALWLAPVPARQQAQDVEHQQDQHNRP